MYFATWFFRVVLITMLFATLAWVGNGQRLTFYRGLNEWNAWSQSLAVGQKSVEQPLCTRESTYASAWTEATCLSKDDEDSYLASMRPCISFREDSNVCVFGYDNAIKATITGEISFLFVSMVDFVCVELYRESLTGDLYFKVRKISEPYTKSAVLYEGGRAYRYSHSVPFYAFLKEASRCKDVPRLFRYTRCSMSYGRNVASLDAFGVFGMKRVATHIAAVRRPIRNSSCSSVGVSDAMSRFAAPQFENVENSVLDFIQVCAESPEGGCEFGVDATIAAYLQGSVITRHMLYDNLFKEDDIIEKDVLHYFKDCIPFPEFAKNAEIHHTLVIRKSLCRKTFDEDLFITLFCGIAGVHMLPATPTSITKFQGERLNSAVGAANSSKQQHQNVERGNASRKTEIGLCGSICLNLMVFVLHSRMIAITA